MEWETTEEYLIKNLSMCLSGAMYLDEDHYDQVESEEKFYTKTSEDWDYYSGLPNPKAYESSGDR